MELMSPKSDDPAQQQSNIILKFLPLMIGWFSLNVPSALTVYWLTNNFITTGTSLFVRSQVKTPEPVGVGGSSTTVVEPPTQTEPIFAPIREKPSGFGDAPISEPSDTIKPLTVDAEIVDAEVETEGGFVSDAPKPRSKGKKRKKKKRGRIKLAKPFNLSIVVVRTRLPCTKFFCDDPSPSHSWGQEEKNEGYAPQSNTGAIPS